MVSSLPVPAKPRLFAHTLPHKPHRFKMGAAVLQALFPVAIEALADYNINYVIM